MPPTLPPLWRDIPQALRAGFDPERPWGLLAGALEDALAALPSDGIEIALPPDVHLIGDRIVIGRGTRLMPGVTIEGPVHIGRDALLRPGAYVRGGSWIGDGAVVGANTEVKRSVLLAGARAPHLAYVGDSVLGRDANLGAGTVLSNFRHDGGEIDIPTPAGRLRTGRRKLGALLGDGVRTGCNCVLHPGCVVGRGTLLYPGVMLRAGVYAADSVVKLRQDIETVPLRGDRISDPS